MARKLKDTKAELYLTLRLGGYTGPEWDIEKLSYLYNFLNDFTDAGFEKRSLLDYMKKRFGKKQATEAIDLYRLRKDDDGDNQFRNFYGDGGDRPISWNDDEHVSWKDVE